MTKSFRASGASTGRNAKTSRICLDCLRPYDPARGVLSSKPAQKNLCHCGGKIERFDSKSEARHYGVLRLREKAGEIFALKCHPRFDLIIKDKIDPAMGVRVGTYTADFEYLTRDETLNQAIRHVVDVKPHKRGKRAGEMLPVLSREAALRIRLFEALYGHKVRMVE